MTFDEAFQTLLVHEGGYSDQAADPGGKTRYGVTEAVAREVGYRGDMRDFPLDLAKRIYRERYWDAVQADQLPEGVRYAVFDAAVNSGARQAVKWLQRAAGALDDGVIGPNTLAAVGRAAPAVLKANMVGQRLQFMTGLPNWQAFSKGWSRRLASILMEAA